MAGLIHFKRVNEHLNKEYKELIDLYNQNEPNIDQNMIRTRILTGFILETYGNCPKDELYSHITDGENDRGIDGIYYDKYNKSLYVVQSKFVNNHTTSPLSETDAKSITSGLGELFQDTLFEFSNRKIQNLREEVSDGINSNDVAIKPIIASTSDKDIPPSVNRILVDQSNLLLGEPEGFQYIRLSDIWDNISLYGGRPGANFQIQLNGYNKIPKPYDGYYGWVTGSTIANICQKHGDRIFSKNLRVGLGDTDTNDDIFDTALNEPDKFWYYNNGITFISDSVSRSLKGGAAADNVELTIENGSIVNGAQTSSTLMRLLNKKEGINSLDRIKCLVRILQIPKEDDEFAKMVTRYNNSQNGISSKDFVSLDPFQRSLRSELDKDFGITYIIRSGEESNQAYTQTITLHEATISLVICGSSVENVVRVKSGIGSLWKDIKTAPYTTIFNREKITALALYKAVNINRKVEEFLFNYTSSSQSNQNSLGSSDKFKAIATHGNRLYAFSAFNNFNIWNEQESINDFNKRIKQIDLKDSFKEFVNLVFDLYGNSYKAPLFKNQQKCLDIISSFQKRLA